MWKIIPLRSLLQGLSYYETLVNGTAVCLNDHQSAQTETLE
jgi:hypothetical protein